MEIKLFTGSYQGGGKVSDLPLATAKATVERRPIGTACPGLRPSAGFRHCECCNR